MLHGDGHRIVAGEGEFPRSHLVQHHAQRVEVGGRLRVTAFQPSEDFFDYSEGATRVMGPPSVEGTRVYREPMEGTQVRHAPPPGGTRRDDDSFAEPPARRTVWPWVMVIM